MMWQMAIKWLTLPETNSSHLKMDDWNTFSFPFGAQPIFRGEPSVSGRVFLIKKTSIWVFPKIRVGNPQIIHLFIGFSIIFTIHFGGLKSYPYFWFNTHMNLSTLPSIHRPFKAFASCKGFPSTMLTTTYGSHLRKSKESIKDDLPFLTDS